MKEYIEKLVTISDPDTETTILAVPKNKIGYIVEVDARNPNTVAAVLTISDKFIPTGSTSATVVNKVSWDLGASATRIEKEGLRKAIFGTVVAQATQASVVLYVGIELI